MLQAPLYNLAYYYVFISIAVPNTLKLIDKTSLNLIFSDFVMFMPAVPHKTIAVYCTTYTTAIVVHIAYAS